MGVDAHLPGAMFPHIGWSSARSGWTSVRIGEHPLPMGGCSSMEVDVHLVGLLSNHIGRELDRVGVHPLPTGGCPPMVVNSHIPGMMSTHNRCTSAQIDEFHSPGVATTLWELMLIYPK